MATLLAPISGSEAIRIELSRLNAVQRDQVIGATDFPKAKQEEFFPDPVKVAAEKARKDAEEAKKRADAA